MIAAFPADDQGLHCSSLRENGLAVFHCQNIVGGGQDVAVKPQIGQCGEGIAKIVTAEIEDRKAFYDKAMQSKACLEELVKQHPAWEALCPGCVNTLRVITGAAAGQSWLLFAATRVGSGTSVADNFHMGGSAVLAAALIVLILVLRRKARR